MNKKIIAIAIAAAMTAPVAMADIKVSGRMAGEFVNSDAGAGSTVMKDTGMASTTVSLTNTFNSTLK